jgi:type I restriction enzyme S subunit
MKRWPIKSLAEVCSRITDGSHRTPTFTEKGFPFVTVVHVDKDGKVDFDACNHISATDYEELKRNDCLAIFYSRRTGRWGKLQ